MSALDDRLTPPRLFIQSDNNLAGFARIIKAAIPHLRGYDAIRAKRQIRIIQQEMSDRLKLIKERT